MKISELIEQLESIKANHGDLSVTKNTYVMGVISVFPPSVEYIRAKRPREHKKNYWEVGNKEATVEKVVAI